jgi:hypothetical protein
MSLYRIINKLYVQLFGRLLPKKEMRNVTLIFCTLGMGELVCMKNLINNVKNAALIIEDKEYIREYLYFTHPTKLALTMDELKKFDFGFIRCIVPAGCMRLPEITEIVRLGIPIRIGQFYKDKTKFKFCFNYSIEIDNFTNQIETSDNLLKFYEDISST